jgi:hypothetical protein
MMVTHTRCFAALSMTELDLAVDEELSSSFEPCLNFLIGIAEQPPRADKSAMGTVNRPLRRAGVFRQCALSAPTEGRMNLLIYIIR